MPSRRSIGGQQASLLAVHWFPFVNRGRMATVRGWIASMDDDAVAADPVTALAAAWVTTLTGEREARARWLAAAERGLFRAPGTRRVRFA